MTNVPDDAFVAIGLFEKRIYVVPSLDIVAIRLGGRNPSWNDNQFLGRVCAACVEYPDMFGVALSDPIPTDVPS
ncbi:MAG: hypothetical protein H8E82_08435 [Candidatus Marinimicrobia bacterium]|nr:hypothetical protein [Candidatus Neomarinimicrobiota bacterium]MBL7047304.1 hypothetical protein [Candidatus Neomarinimicrobiota bacterium]